MQSCSGSLNLKDMKIDKLLILATLFVLVACGKKTETVEEGSDSTYIVVSKKQFAANQLHIGTMSNFNFAETLHYKGTVSALPSGIATVSSPVSGIVKTVNVIAGDQVSKGQVLCTLSGNAFLSLQQEFSEAAVQFKLNKREYERTKLLFEQNIGSEKDYLQTESNYKISRARYEALSRKINLLNLPQSKIENGEIFYSFNIETPVSGNIIRAEASIGKNVDEQTQLFEIVDLNQLVLNLQIFETDINKIKSGQKVVFTVSDNNEQQFEASIFKVGKSVDPATKTILCLATIVRNNQTTLINNAYANAAILVAERSLKGLPTDAIVKTNNEFHVLLLEKEDANNYYFKKSTVETGNSNEQYTEIVSGLTNEQQVLINGAFNLITE